ncbi:MAG TPA: hypothetical protein VLQ45_23615 [Thermoanaerobaculia bacterium]|nr:hypothetical protein [Thermoanaerobaculia bacterium]
MKTLALALALLAMTPFAPATAQEFTTDFDVERCTFVSHGRQNPYFSLQPGDQVTLEGEDDGEEIEVQITVKRGTRKITFTTPEGTRKTVRARVVEEKEWKDGELAEISRNWFARCIETNDVFYFGESVDFYEDGRIVGHEGSWQAGVDGAQPGIIIPARFLLGARYFQEIAPEAMDRAENVEMGLTVTAAGETFEDCVKVRETSPLEPDDESVKVYCPGVGMVQDGEIELTDCRRD